MNHTSHRFNWRKAPNQRKRSFYALLAFFICSCTLLANARGEGNGTPMKRNGLQSESPQVNAGNDTTIFLPTNSLKLTGQANDADGTITAYQWIKVSGPEGETINQPDSASTLVTGLAAGTYLFRLVATDNAGLSASDDVTVVVLAVPAVANAGRDTLLYKNQTRPDSAFLSARLSTGSSYHWELLSGPTIPLIQTPDSLTTWVTGIAEGAYQFKLLVDGVVSDTVAVAVRDWQKKGVYPCRPGYDTATKTGGLNITLEPNYKGTYLKSDGTSGTWNQWNYILNVRAYVESTKKLTLYGGDTLLLQGADSTVWIELGGFGGNKGCPVYVIPKGKPVRMRGVNSFFRFATRDSNAVQYVVVDGTALRSAGHPYGFLFDNSNLGYAGSGPFTGGWIANLTLKGLRSTRTNALKIKLDPNAYPFSRFDKFVQKNIVITDNWIDSSSVEGMYIGSSATDGGQLNNSYGPPPRMDSVEISNNIVTNCGWDGIQLANAKNGCVIKHNLVYKAGTANMPSQRAGILMGGNTTGVVDSNIIINSKGNGIQVFGYGNVNVYNNVIDSIYGGKGDQDGMYQSFIVFTSEPTVAPLRMYNYNNLIGRVERNMIRMANTNGKMLPGRTHHNTFIHPTATTSNSLIVTYAKDVLDNNSIVPAFSYKLNAINRQEYGATITMTQGDTIQTFASIKATVDWLFKRLNGVTAANVPPVVAAGADQRINRPQDSVLLAGSATDEDGSVKSYQWKKVSGPDNSVFQTPNLLQTGVKGLVAGTYKFELAATDNGNGIGRDTIAVTVNTPPVANAGKDQIVTLPANSAELMGTATDADGTIAFASWTKLSGPVSCHLQDTTAIHTTAGLLTSGVYTFELKVTDNDNGTAVDTVVLTINTPPSVSAGVDQIAILPVNTFSLQGSASDADGTVTAVQWKKISGPAAYRIQVSNELETVVDSLQHGTYLFALIATDDLLASTADTLSITVNPALNITPLAFAGMDTVITLPANSVVLKGTGTDRDGSITSYQWAKIAGPTGATITAPSQAQTTVSGLVAGSYRFELRVTDDRNGIGKDTIAVTVNKPPVVNAGPDQSLTLPTNTVILSGNGTDTDGSISIFTWTKISGPAQGAITSAGAAVTTITGLAAGSYLFRLMVTDNLGATASDDVAVIVNNVPAATTKTINVNIYGGTNPYANSAWNNWSLKTKTASNSVSTAFKYSDGATSTVSAMLSNSSGIADNGASYGGSMAPAQVLRYVSYYTGTRTLILKGLSASKKYNIELYASRNTSGSSTVFTINGVTQSVTTFNNLTNKAAYTNLSANSSGQVTITIAKTGSFNCINGFSITETSSTTASAILAGTRQMTEEPETVLAVENVELFPNPAADQVFFKLANKQTGMVTVNVITPSGHVVKSGRYTKEQPTSRYEISTRGLAPGIYFLKIKIGSWQVSKKFVKL